MKMMKYGMMGGFATPEEAERSAFLATFGQECVILEKNGEWAWVTPPSYARRVVDAIVEPVPQES